MASIISTKPVVKKKSQPSRKGKKAWRKNVDIKDVEKALEGIRTEERIIGGRLRDLPDEKIFTIDTTCDADIKKKIDKRFAKLKIDQILEDRSKIPAVSSKPIKQNKYEKHHVSKYTKIKLEELMKRKKDHVQANETISLKTGEYDVWDEKKSKESHDNDFLHPVKKRKIKPPPTINMKPSETVPAVHFPHPGASYNPTFKDHQNLLGVAHEEEVVKLQKKQKLQSQLPVLSEVTSSALIPEDMVDKDTYEEVLSEDGVEDDEKDEEDAKETIKQSKNKRKKTRADRNKKKRKFATLKDEQERKAKKEFRKKLEKLPEIIQTVESEVAEREKQQAEKIKASEEKANLPLKKIGKYPVKKLPINVQLQEELSDSLRTLKPEGNLFHDRMVSLEERNIIEPRVRVSKKRKYKLREFEKSSYKN